MRETYLDAGLTVPASFKVNEIITVQGSVIRVEPPLRKGRTFSVRDAAGLTVHSPRGRSFENVLFDAQGQPLCRFTRGEKNGEVFIQYLQNQGVPFFRPDGQPLEPIRPADTAPGPRFTLQLRRTDPIGVWIALGIGLGLLLFLFGFPAVGILSGPYAEQNLGVLTVISLALIVGPWILALVKGQLFPPILFIEGERMWISHGLGRRELLPEDMDCCCFQRSDECYVLYDKRGKSVAKFSTRDDFGPQFLDFLTSRNIRVRSSK